MAFNSEEQAYIDVAREDIRKNQLEIVKAIAITFGINRVDFDKSIAVLTDDKLLASIIYGDGFHLSKCIPIEDPLAIEIINLALSNIADLMRDQMENYRQLSKKSIC